MRKKQNKNYTIYWMAGVSAVLTIPISIIIFRSVQAGNVAKSVMIMAVFLVLLIAIMLLYKNIFGVSVQEITQEDKVTELDRLSFTLTELRKKYRNLQLIKYIDMMNEQIQRFKRRKNVMFQVAGIDSDSTDSGSMGDLVQSVEDALLINIERMINRVEIFDDEGVPEVVKQNIGYIEEQVHKNDEILMVFETLITETSRMGEIQKEKDITKLWDVVNAMKTLRSDQNSKLDELTKKYDKENK